MKETLAFTRKLDKLTLLYPRLPKMAGVVAVNFFKNRFRTQDWIDNTSHPWEGRKRKSSTKRGILVNSGRLKRSIRITRSTYNSIWIGTDVPYAQIHNEGGRVKGTARVSAHNRKAFTRRRKGRKETVQAHAVKAHARKVNFIMPRRQFMGTSAVLDKKIERTLTAEIMRALK
ncbi:MAG: hypothetical protein COC06_07625 [Bacteroidales bacterium]|nr:MAG: hypothetical protein COC06_07625 [Bacteroidales bacterium]